RVPAIHFRRLEVRRYRIVNRAHRELPDRRRRTIREWIASGGGAPRLRNRNRSVHRRIAGERRDVIFVLIRLQIDEVVIDSGAHAERSLAVAEGIERDTHARLEVLPRSVDTRLAVKPRVARIVESRRRVGPYAALGAGGEAREAERIDAAVAHLHR